MPSFCTDCGEPADDMGKCRRCGKSLVDSGDANARWGRDKDKEDVSNRFLNKGLTSVNASGAGVAQRGQGADPTLRSMLGDDSKRFVGETVHCATCKQLASPAYSKTEGGPKYCSDCYRKVATICAGCNRAITEGETVTQGSQKYHRQCYSSDVQCESCSKVIFGQAVSALGKNWHPDCFVCHGEGCKAKITDTFAESNGFPYCQKCASKPNVRRPAQQPQQSAAEREADAKRRAEVEQRNREAEQFRQNVNKGKELTLCVECGRHITGDGYNIGGIQRHVECSKCSKCGKAVNESNATDHDGDLVCTSCAQPKASNPSRCAGCLKDFAPGIKFVSVAGHKYHKNCLKCTYCKKPFEGTQMAERDGQFFHPACITPAPQTRTVTKQGSTTGDIRQGFIVDPITGQKKFC